tara:strand:- start:2895 stop:4454 length:1560 start_codon:yes stop_codon:yes gene_type:complete
MENLKITNVFKYFEDNPKLIKDQWLVLGKGPSLDQINQYNLSDYRIVSLNDSLIVNKNVTLGHFIDLDAFERCSKEIALRNDIYIIMPWYPHVDSKPGVKTLDDLVKTNSILNHLAREKRLLWYDLMTSDIRTGEFPIINAVYFSVEAVFDIFSKVGIKYIKSLGIDGGIGYSALFHNINKNSHLVNKQASFDNQFSKLAEIIFKSGISHVQLNHDCPIKIYIGCTRKELLPAEVLKYSIEKNSHISVDIKFLFQSDINIPEVTRKENQARTPFSFQRFIIPEICNYSGKAIYLDADMLVFKNIIDLWENDFNDANILLCKDEDYRKPQLSVMMLDCSNLKWNIKDIVSELNNNTLTYNQLMHDFTIAKYDMKINKSWNTIDKFDNKTSLLHYTDMTKQPWLSTTNHLGYKWMEVLLDAIDDNYISIDFIQNEIEQGHVRPSLLYQINNNVTNGLLLSKKILQIDQSFDTKHGHNNKNINPWKNIPRWILSKIIDKYYNSFLYRIKIRAKKLYKDVYKD